jgi:hypothetical protein
MKKWWWIIVAALVLLGVGFAWFWSLAAVAPEETLNVTLKVERGPVQVRAPGETTFHDAVNGMTLLPGQVVRTGEGGRAVIVFFGQAESRVDANSEVAVAEAVEGDADGGTRVRLEMGNGRIWSRVLRFFDLDSSFSVQTPSVVATVRGTAFDVRAQADGTSEVWVSESAVTIAPASDAARVPDLPEGEFRAVTSSPVLTAGESALYGKDGKPQWRKPIQAEDRASAWFTENRMADELFQRDALERRRTELDGRKNQAVQGLARLSERLHLAVAKGDEEDRDASVYAARRLAAAIALAEAGRTGVAAQVFARFENEAKGKLTGMNADRERRVLRDALERVAPLLEDTAPSSPAYPFKQRIEDMTIEVAPTDDASLMFARLRAADARLDEAARLLDAGTLEEAQTALQAAHGGLENARRDSRTFLLQLGDARKSALSGKLLALIARDAAERARLEAALAPVAVVAATSTTEGTATSTKPGIVRPPSTPATPTSTQTGTSAYSGIGVYIQPNPIGPGATAKLSALATKIGGGTEDVSSKSTYRIISGVGTLTGSTFIATVPGNVVFEATFTDQGKQMISRGTLSVTGGLASLDRLDVSAAPLAPKAGERVTLTATARYTNNLTKDVSGNVIWKNLDVALGTIAGNIFTPSTTVSGNAQLQATYTEDGVTKISSVYVTVTAQTTRPAPYNY